MEREDRNRKIMQAIKKQTKAALETKSSARAALIMSGIYDKCGRLRPEFGGQS